MLGAQAQGIDDAQDLVEVAPGRHRIDEDELDLLVGADHEDVAQRRVLCGSAFGGVALNVGRKHPVSLGDLEVGVGDHRVVRGGALRLLDVLGPLLVVVDGVDGQADDLHVALVEFRLDAGHVAELCRADGREVTGVREEDGPGVADPVVEPDLAFRGFRLEVGGVVADREHVLLRMRWCFGSESGQKVPNPTGFPGF